jgi:hypothetical protein
MVGFYSLRPELTKAGIVGLYLDSVGDVSRADYPFTLHRTGVAQPSYANSLAQLVLDRLPADKKARYFWRHENEIPVADHMISDPMVGIVSPWLGRGHDFGRLAQFRRHAEPDRRGKHVRLVLPGRCLCLLRRRGG